MSARRSCIGRPCAWKKFKFGITTTFSNWTISLFRGRAPRKSSIFVLRWFIKLILYFIILSTGQTLVAAFCLLSACLLLACCSLLLPPAAAAVAAAVAAASYCCCCCLLLPLLLLLLPPAAAAASCCCCLLLLLLPPAAAASSSCCCCCFLLLLLPLVQTFCRKRKLQSRSPCLALAGDTGGRRQQREGMFTEGRTYETFKRKRMLTAVCHWVFRF